MKNLFCSVFLSLFLVSYVFSENILEIYDEALKNDPTFKAAEYSYLADKEIVVQGRAALLPSITLSGSTNWNEYYQNKELQQQYNSFSGSARLSQPLFRLDTWFQFRQSKSLTDAAEADFAFEQQSLVLRTAELYFGVLRAIDNLNASISEEKAIKKQLDQAQQRFEVGLSAITGVQEAQLAYDLSKASRINIEGKLFSAREALNALIGREIFSVDELGDDLIVTVPTPNSKEKWVELALTNNYQQADTGTKMIHVGKNTKSRIVSKGISAGNSKNTYRGLVNITNKALGARNYSQCDSLLIGNQSNANTFPIISVQNSTTKIEHEASTSKIGEEQIFYFLQRGISIEKGIELMISGFCRDVFTELPLEFAAEADRLLSLKLEGSVG